MHGTKRLLHRLAPPSASSNRFLGKAILNKGAAAGPAAETLRIELGRLEQERSTRVNPDLLASVIRLCEDAKVLDNVRRVHDHVLHKGKGIPTTLVGNLLVRAYGKCGAAEEARRVFDGIPHKNDFSWGCMLTAYNQNGRPHEALELYRNMDVAPNAVIFAAALGACSSVEAIEDGRAIHSRILGAKGLNRDVVLDNALLSMYARCGCVEEARRVFEGMPRRTVVSWNAIVAAYAQNGHFVEAIHAYERMCKEGLDPNDITFTTVLVACAELEDLDAGTAVHARVASRRHPPDVTVVNALVTMYGKCRRAGEALQIFEAMASSRNVCSWSAIVGALADSDQPRAAVAMYHRMQLEGVPGNPFAFASALRACLCGADLSTGTQIHAQIRELGLQSSVTLGTTLVALYSSAGRLDQAEAAFESVSNRDAACWTALILAYAKRELSAGVLELFKRMKAEGVAATRMIYALVASACTSMGAFAEARAIHTESEAADARMGLDLYAESSYGTSLVSMYAKAGNLEEAQLVFDRMEARDVRAWSSLVSGYSKHGSPAAALERFWGMQLEGVDPNEVTFTAILHACAHGGIQRMGRDLFLSMQGDHGVGCSIEHYGAMVDLLARVGRLQEAEELIECMPFEPSKVPWNSLLSACRAHKDVKRAARVAARVAQASPTDVAAMVQLSNVHAASGDFAAMARVRATMVDKGLKKRPGSSSIEVEGNVHEFAVGGDGEGNCVSHPQIAEVMRELKRLSAGIRKMGYVPEVGEVLHDVREEEKELLLCLHSEKLAIAFGMISTPPGTTLRVFNTLRICPDCHSAVKFISNLEKREIVVRDSNRFHRFREGQCTCGDFW